MLRSFNLAHISSTLVSSHFPRKVPITLQKTLRTITVMSSSSFSSSSWACPKCTFLNPTFQNSRCEICLSPKTQCLLPSSSSPPSASPSNSKWSCTACTFMNPYRSTVCEICGTRASASMRSGLELDDDDLHQSDSSIGSVFLPLLRACSNPVKESAENPAFAGISNGNSRNSYAGTGRILGKEGTFTGLKPCCNKRKDREDDAAMNVDTADKAVEMRSLGETPMSSDCKTWKILSYNIWFREDLEMRIRMNALGYLIQLHSPDVICLQEVTPSFYDIFKKSSWWKGYRCSIADEKAFPGGYFCMQTGLDGDKSFLQLCKLPVKSYSSRPFYNSIMGRELSIAEIEIQPGMELFVATSHLESPCPGPPTWDQMFSKERVDQAKEAVKFLDKNPNVIFCGDMNWDDKLDGPFPLSDGWLDAWTELRPGEVGFTYDTKSNMMLSGNRTLQKRLDRFLCKLRDFKISEIKMIGTDAIPGVTYIKEKRVKGQVKELALPVLPSDHYGLLLTISAKDST